MKTFYMSFRSWFKWHGQDVLANISARILWPRTSAGVIVLRDGKILALDLDDYMTLPIGGSDKGETFEETARRETREETGIEVEIGERIEEGINSNGGIEAIFRAEMIGGELDGNYIEGRPRWIEIEDAKKRNWRYDRDIEELIRKAQKL